MQLLKKSTVIISKLSFIVFIVAIMSSCGGGKNYYSSKATKKGCGCPSAK